MKNKWWIVLVLFLACCGYTSAQKHRLVILADMGNEPDEEQQMMHMLMYANEFDLEGLIAVTGKFLRPKPPNMNADVLHPELFNQLINGYAKVVENLKKHASGYPDAAYLKSIVVKGQQGYGIEATGPGLGSPGSRRIIQVLEEDDPRPVYIVVNAGANTLAQALKDVQATRSKEELQRLIARLRVYENGAQDNAGAWICSNFPDIFWIRSNHQTYCYGGPDFDGGSVKGLGPYTWKPYAYSPLGQHQWALEHIIADHGAFGRCWPLRQFRNGKIQYVEGGGTIPWLGLVRPGLSDINQPHWGGWSGRYTREKVKNVWSRHKSVNTDEKKGDDFYMFTEATDRWTDPDNGEVYDNNFAPVWRWRQAYFNDFKCRMDWCIQPFEKANHHPKIVLNGEEVDSVMRLAAKAGDVVALDAAASNDPDNDKLSFSWWNYQEAGTYEKPLELTGSDQPKIRVAVPEDAAGKQVHIILEVSDNNPIASMTNYRRIVIDVAK